VAGLLVLGCGGGNFSISIDGLDCRQSSGTVPLVGAAGRGDEAKITELLSKGESIDQVNADRRTPLFCAVVERQTGAAKLLIDRGADVNKANAAGDTPLLWAADKGNAELVEMLLAKGADPNRLSDNGHGPLFRAIAGGHPELALELLAAGAEATTDTRIDHASACGITEEMNRRGTGAPVPGWPTTTARTDDALAYSAAASTTTATSTTTVPSSGSTGRPASTAVNSPPRGGPTPWPGMALDGCVASQNLVLSPPRATEHVTPLLAATYRFQPSVVRALLDKGASPQVLAFDRFSPLYIAALLGDDESVQALLDRGALADAPPHLGVPTAWEAACLGGHLTTARLVGQSVWDARGLSGEVPTACPLALPPAAAVAAAGPPDSGGSGSTTTRR